MTGNILILLFLPFVPDITSRMTQKSVMTGNGEELDLVQRLAQPDGESYLQSAENDGDDHQCTPFRNRHSKQYTVPGPNSRGAEYSKGFQPSKSAHRMICLGRVDTAALFLAKRCIFPNLDPIQAAPGAGPRTKTHARFHKPNEPRSHHQRTEPGHPCGVQSVAVVAEAQDREADLDDGAPGRVHGGH